MDKLLMWLSWKRWYIIGILSLINIWLFDKWIVDIVDASLIQWIVMLLEWGTVQATKKAFERK